MIGLWIFPLLSLGQNRNLGDKTNGEEVQIKAREQWFQDQRGFDAISRPDLYRKVAIEDAKRLQREEGRSARRAAWTSLGPSPMTMLSWVMGKVSGRVTDIDVHPIDDNIIYLSTAGGGLWKTTDGGATWAQLFDDIGTQSIGSVFLDPNNPETLWVGTGQHADSCTGYFGMGLFKSADGGASFSASNGAGANSLDLSFIASIVFHPGNSQTVLVGGHGYCDEGTSTEGGIFRSTDNGLNWERVFTGQASDVISDPTDADVFYAAVGRSSRTPNGIYKSVDGGKTWNRQENGIAAGSSIGRARLAMAPSDPQTLYALLNVSGGGRIYKTTDGGASWNLQSSSACEGQCWYNLCLDIHPTNPEILLIGSIRHAISTNSGQTLNYLTTTWGSAQKVHQDTHVIKFDPNDGTRFWVGTDGGLWRTDDNGSNYNNLNDGLNITQFYDIAVHPVDTGRVFGGAQDNSSLRTAGATLWNVTAVTGDGFMNLVDPIDPDIVFQTSYPSGGPSVLRSTTGGDPGTYNWLSMAGVTNSEPWPWKTPMEITSNSAGTQSYMFIGSNRVYMSSNNGSNWTPQTASLASSSLNVITAIPFEDRIVVYAGGAGVIYHTDDALAATPVWNNVTGDYPGGTVTDIAIDRSNPMRVFVTRGAFGLAKIYRSTTGGTTWEAIGTGVPDVPANAVSIDPLNSDRIFLGSDVGMFDSTDGGENFGSLMMNFPLGTVVTDLEISADPHLLTAGTYGRGAWQMPLQAEDVSVDAGPDEELCLTDAADLEAVGSNGLAPFEWTWSIMSGPDTDIGQFSDNQIHNPVFTPTSTGEYLLQVSIEDSSSNIASDQLSVYVSTVEEFTSQQMEAWTAGPGGQEWQNRLDRNDNDLIEIMDLLMQIAAPICY